MKKLLKNKYLKDEIRSIFATALSFIVVDGGVELMNIYNGDLSKTALMGFLFVLIRSFIKALLTFTFPKFFPIRKSHSEV